MIYFFQVIKSIEMIKQILVIIAVQLSTYNSIAQSITHQTITSAGQLISNQGINLNFTTGELVIENLKSTEVGINTGLFGKENEETNVLPVTLRDFRLVLQGSKVKLYWIVSLEKNTLFYDLQKSFDGTAFSMIGKVKAIGNNSINYEYNFTDNEFYKKSYYRLKIADADGNYKFSNVLTAAPAVSPNKVVVYPNPAKNFVNVNISSNKADTAFIHIRNSFGSSVMAKTYILSQGQNVISINVNPLLRGAYIISIKTKENQLSQSIIKF